MNLYNVLWCCYAFVLFPLVFTQSSCPPQTQIGDCDTRTCSVCYLANAPWNICAGNVSSSNCNCTTVGTPNECNSYGSCSWCGVANSCYPRGACNCLNFEKTQCALSQDCVWCKTQNYCSFRSSGSCEDCSGKVNGTSQYDRCRVCGGDNACLGCDSLPFGADFDVCGVCGGNNMTCAGCDGIPYSRRIYDQCGICGGGNECIRWIGILLSIIGNLFISAGLNLQKHAHNKVAALDAENVLAGCPEDEVVVVNKKTFTQLKAWWAGIVFMCGGEIGNFMAYGYAPATVVSPLGIVSVIANSVIAHLVLKEKPSFRNLLGCALSCAGAALISVFAPQGDGDLDMETLQLYLGRLPVIIYLSVVTVAFFALLMVKKELKNRYVIIYVLICSLLGTITVMSIKGLSTALVRTFEGENQFVYWLTYVLLFVTAVTIVLQIRFLNMAMMNFGASIVVPVYYVFFSMAAISGAMVLYQEYETGSIEHTVLFLVGIVLTFMGVYLVAKTDELMSRRASTVNNSSSGRPPFSPLMMPGRASIESEKSKLLHDAAAGYGTENGTMSPPPEVL